MSDLVYMKCKDYFILKIRYYADEKLLKKWRVTQGPLPLQHMERAQAYNEFQWKAVEFITGKKNQYFFFHYPLSTKDCALEELEDDFGIHICRNEAHDHWLIPKSRPDILEWCVQNLPNNPFKVLKKMKYIGHRFIDKNFLTFRRRDSADFKIQHPEYYEKIKSPDDLQSILR